MEKNKYVLPWYLNSIVIGILAAFSIFIIPAIIAILLVVKQNKLLNEFRQEALKSDNAEAKLRAEVGDKKVDLVLAREEFDKVIAELERAKNEMERKTQRSAAALEKIKSEILVAEDTIELESFALYKPRFKFANAEEYKNKLLDIRDQQKLMLKEGTAARGNSSWAVNNSSTQGKHLIKDVQKLCLRSFNNECDTAVASVKFNNYDRCEARIRKSAEAVEKLGKIMGIFISGRYVELKIKELQLALEYETKKQEEKEALRELKAQQREEAQARKEMEQAKQAAEKEQKHYTNALTKITEQLASCSDLQREELSAKKSEIESHLARITESIKDLDYRQANIKAGYVYVISNIGAFGENVYKIGMTRRLDPQERVDELGDASVPFKFDVHAMIFSENAPALEAALHREFESKKVNMINGRKEFFRVSLDEIKKVVFENHDKAVEFIDVPDAEQYRESLKIANA